MEVIDSYGSDATRIGLISARSAGQSQAFGPDKVVAGRNFCNKLWNIARYAENVLGEELTEAGDPQPESPADHWIIRELVDAKQKTAMLLEQYRFAEAFETVYHTIWDKVADWYVEASKTSYNAPTMLWVLEASLVMAHPFAPFVTETIWQTLDWHSEDEDMLITTKWQLSEQYDEALASQFEKIQAIVTETREVLAAVQSKDVALTTVDSSIVLENAELLKHLTRVGLVQSIEQGSGLRLTTSHEQVWLDLDDEQIAHYTATLKKRLTEIEQAIEALEKRLSNESYVKNAPEALVVESKEELAHKNSQAEHLRHQLKHL
jgi:valyl-tRNA synthetase